MVTREDILLTDDIKVIVYRSFLTSSKISQLLNVINENIQDNPVVHTYIDYFDKMGIYNTGASIHHIQIPIEYDNLSIQTNVGISLGYYNVSLSTSQQFTLQPGDVLVTKGRLTVILTPLNNTVGNYYFRLEGIKTWDGREIVKSTTDFSTNSQFLGRGMYSTYKEACINTNCNFAWVNIAGSIGNFWEKMRVLKFMSDNDIGPKLFDYTTDGQFNHTIISEKMVETIGSRIKRYATNNDLTEWSWVIIDRSLTNCVIDANMESSFPLIFNKYRNVVNKLHSLGWYHNDLHVHDNNAMLDRDDNVKLIDFDTASQRPNLMEERMFSHMNVGINVPVNANAESFNFSTYQISSPIQTPYRVYMHKFNSSLDAVNVLSYLLMSSITDESAMNVDDAHRDDILATNIAIEKGKLCMWIEDPSRSPSNRVIFIGVVRNNVRRDVDEFDQNYSFFKRYNPQIDITYLKFIYQRIVANNSSMTNN